MVINGFMLLVFGLCAGIYYNFYRSSYLSLLNDVKNRQKIYFAERGTRAFGKELRHAQTELGECKSYIMNNIGLDERDSIYYCKLLGKHWHELDPEAWVDIRLSNNFVAAYVKTSPMGEDEALIELGKRMYPMIARVTGLPAGLKTPIDYLRYETEGYLANVRGRGVTPRRIVKMEDGHVIVQAKIRAWDCRIQEGVYLGILEMVGASGGVAEQRKCVKSGDDICEFHVTWQSAVPAVPAKDLTA